MMDIAEFVEVYDEPRHVTRMENEYVRVIKVDIQEGTESLFHRHSENSFFLFFQSVTIRNDAVGREAFDVSLDAGSFYWGDHLLHPMVHKVCALTKDLNCMDIEIKGGRPHPTAPCPALGSSAGRNMCFENDYIRAYRVVLAPAQDVAGKEEFTFPCLLVALTESKLSVGDVHAGDHWWHDGGQPNNSCPWGNRGVTEARLMIIETK